MAKARKPAKSKKPKSKQGLTEAQIAVHWKEEDYFHPSKKFIAQANLADPSFVKQCSENHFPECFNHYASLLHGDKPWRKTLDTSNPPFWKWFVGGKLNACYNCVDRHLAQYKNKAALIFIPEPESEPATVITYQELYRRVNEVAAMLRDFAGLKNGDRVTIHMPMIPELPITMLACARLGVVHSVVFGGGARGGRGEGTRAGSLHFAQAGGFPAEDGAGQRDRHHRNDDREDCAVEARSHRAGHAQDALGKNHAAGAGGDFEQYGYG